MNNFKLKRLTIEELQKIMPIVSESEQKEQIGRAYVMGSPGQMLSESYQPDPNNPDYTTVYFMRPDSVTYYNGIPVYNYTSATPTSMSLSTWDERKKMINSLSESKLGIYNLVFYNGNVNTEYGCFRGFEGARPEFNISSKLFQGNVNINDIFLIILHENNHYLNGITSDLVKDEKNALNAMVNSIYFDNASATIKDEIRTRYKDIGLVCPK